MESPAAGTGLSLSTPDVTYFTNPASECASATMTSPSCSPAGLPGTVTKTWMARTVRPELLATVPSEQLATRVPLLSQNCSFRITKPIPGNSIVVLGGGFALTGVPITTSPTNSVPSALDDAPPS